MPASFDLAKVRHELRTPINHILGYCEILLEEEDMPEVILEDLRKIRQGGKQLLELISRYLDDATFKKSRDWQRVQHELRTPVNHIIGYSELLIEQATELGQRTLVADLAKIRTAAQQWLSLMETYLLGTEPQKQQDHTPKPAEPPGKVAPLAESPPGVTAQRTALTGSLLVVDDDQPSRELLARRLHRLGFQVATAVDGQEALDLVSSRSFDLLLVDCVMPGMDGLELLRRVRQQKAMNELPIIMVTGRDSSGDVVQALKLGANDYLTKPVDFEVALARLAAHLELLRAQTELKKRMQEIRGLADNLQVRNEFIKQVFGRYVTDAVVQSVLENPKGLELGGQRRVVTVLMSDLRGFTGMAEQLAPEKVVELLNIFLGTMAEVIVQNNGVVDEFIGDGILALFGAPLTRADHAESAVACALAMQVAMERVNRRLSRLGVAPIEMGVGINTGDVVIGNIGSDKRAKYGAVGAHVNLASRIQSITVGGEVLVSENTAAALGTRLKADRTLTVSLKGASAPIKLHSVIGLRGQDHLDLPQPEPITTGTGTTFAVRAFRLSESKMLARDGFEGQLTFTSHRSGILATQEALHARTDLKLVISRKNSDGTSDLYCKVMEDTPGQFGWAVRFTSAFKAADFGF
jgi:class 3 adenylate cyclase/CheY-like chemotaxis protein